MKVTKSDRKFRRKNGKQGEGRGKKREEERGERRGEKRDRAILAGSAVFFSSRPPLATDRRQEEGLLHLLLKTQTEFTSKLGFSLRRGTKETGMFLSVSSVSLSQ